MKYSLVFLLLFVSVSCKEDGEHIYRENCDFDICEFGRINVDTLLNTSGMLLEENGQEYIEVTGNGFQPHKHYISCQEGLLELPDIGSYVHFGAFVKDACSTEVSVSSDSVSVFEIEMIEPSIQESCQNQILMEGFDIDQNDEKLKIHHLAVNDDCLNVLISYAGSCDQIPALSLHAGGDLLFGGAQIVVSLQGTIDDDCMQEQYAVLQFDLTPLRDSLSGSTIQDITLYFLSQGLLRVQYLFNE